MAEGRHIQELMILYAGGVNGALLLAGSAVEAKVGATRMEDRKVLSVFNLTGATIYWGWSSAGANATDGFPILNNTGLIWTIDGATPIYLHGTGDVRVQEAK